MDNELFELCKEVYGRTVWYGTALLITKDGPTMVGPMDKESSVPLYTSDYLLEKLPDALDNPSFNISYRLQLKKIDDWYTCEYSNHGWFRDMKSVLTRKGYDTNDDSLAYGIKPVSDDTPLKALLKLVIALDDAGVKL